jgi:hypothetical protein
VTTDADSLIRLCWPQEAAPATASRRALLLAYHYPPDPSVGSHRPEALTRWLGHYGWEPTVLTAERAGLTGDVIGTPDGSWMGQVRRGDLSAVQSVARTRGGTLGAVLQMGKMLLRRFPRWHDEYTGWSYPAIARAIDEGRRRNVDLVWATCPPFSLARTATLVAAALGVPCVVDLRDPLSEYLQYTTGQGHWFYRAIRHADAVTLATVSCATESLARAVDGRPLYPIISGMWHPEPVPAQPSDRFTILHAGTLYGSARDPRPLFAAVARLADEVPGFRAAARIRLVGSDSATAAALPEFAPVADLCEIIGPTPYREVTAMMAAASTLVILMGDEWYLRDAVPAKLYDYLPYAAPILAIGGQRGVLADLLEWSRAGLWTTDTEAITNFLRAHFLAWQAHGAAAAPRNPEALAYLTQQRMAAETAAVLDAACTKTAVPCRERPAWLDPS